MRLSKLFIALMILSFYSCKKEKTSWDSPYKLIIVNDTLTLNNLSKDSIFSDDGMGNTQLVFDQSLLDYNVFNLIHIPDTAITQKYAIALTSFNVSPGTSFISNAENYQLDMEDAQLTMANVSSGTITLKVGNPYGTKVTYTLLLPKVRKDGIMLQRTLVIDQGTRTNPTIKTISIDASGYSIDLTGTNGNSYNQLQTILNAKSDPNGPTILATNLDTTVFSAQFSDLKLNYARGYFGNKVRDLSFDKTINFFNKLSGIVAVDDYNFDLVMSNSCKVEAKLNVNHITNVNSRTNSSKSLQNSIIGTPILVQAATGNGQNLIPYQRTFNFNVTNSNLSDFIANLGEKFSGDISLQLNPNGNNSLGWNELYSNSGLKVNLKANMPIKIGLSNFIFKDTLDFNFSNSTDKTHLKSGKFVMNVSNAYPIDLKADIIFLGANGQIVGQVSSSDRVKSSIEGSDYKNGIQYAKSSVEFNVSEDLAGKMSTAKKIILVMKANTFSNTSVSSPKMTNIPYKAFVAVKLYADFNTTFKF